MVEKEKVSFEDILATLDKDTLSKVKIGSEINREIVPTASYGLNRILGGGFRKGKQHTIWGGEQSAKTGLMLCTAGINQKRGENIAWIDAEHSFDPEWAARLGCDPSKILVSEVSTIGELTDLQVKLIKAGMDMIIIDSTSALMPKSYVDKDGELKAFADTMQMAQMAKDLGQMCKMIQGINYSCAVVHISQARVDVGSPAMTKPFKPTGGKEVEHTDSFRVRLMSSKSDAKAKKGNVEYGDVTIEEKIGIPVTWMINKNKINGRYGEGDYDFYIGGDFVGLDTAGELLDYGTTYGLVEKGGAWYTIYGERLQGRDAAIRYLRSNPTVLEKIEAELNDI
jgi:recombination protein RecA